MFIQSFPPQYVMAYRPPPSTKWRRELSLPPPLSVQTQLGVQRISVIRPICSVSFSLACRPGEPCSVARGSASAAFTFQMALPSPLPLNLIRTRRRRAAAAGTPQAAVDIGFNHLERT